MELGVIGLGTMGANLARNAARNGVHVAVFNRTTKTMENFIKNYSHEGTFFGANDLKLFCERLHAPRKILLMVKAGDAVDQMIETILPYLNDGDILIDGGNSLYLDTKRREKELSQTGIRFLGMGVSGGEEGALLGPSLMPGGDHSAYNECEDIFMNIAADSEGGGKCVTYLGTGGAGHFVKMVHNGIEYGIMQILAESYDILKRLGSFSNEDLAETFSMWNKGEDLRSYLVEITGKIFKKKDGEEYLIDFIKDAAGRKGTGRWTVESALQYGVSIPTIFAGLNARILSGSSGVREYGIDLPEVLDLTEELHPKEKMRSVTRAAVELATILTYMQGYELLKEASKEEGWDLALSDVSRIWRGGCIIRSTMLNLFQGLYSTKAKEVQAAQEGLRSRFDSDRQFDFRHVVDLGLSRGVPLPALSSALSYFDSIRATTLPQNLTQAQRDFFGAHTFERVDKKGAFHTEWEE